MPIVNTRASESADERLEARVTSRQKALFREAADLQGVTLTDFIVASVHEAAMRALEARHILQLSGQDQRAFVEAILRPPAPNTRLKAAWSRHAFPARPRSAATTRRPRRRSRD